MASLELSKEEIEALVSANHPAPRSALGFHEVKRKNGARAWVVRVLEPDAESVQLVWQEPKRPRPRKLRKLHPAGLFEAVFRPRANLHPYRLLVRFPGGRQVKKYDPYFFSPRLTDFDLYLHGEGNHHRIYEKLGAHSTVEQGVRGTRFAVWAPAARRVSVVGPFNLWDGRRHAMQNRGQSGIWELFIPGVVAGTPYKYEIKRPDGRPQLKADPYAFATQLRPDNCSVVTDLSQHVWNDQEWLERRRKTNWREAPLNIYEVHPGSWRRTGDSHTGFLSWQQLADQLIPYVKGMGYTHIELMGLAEHPYDGSWGYQVTAYYAATARHGSPADLMAFIDQCHQAGIGVIMDWVPAHFPKDEHGLANFDGTCLFEHEDPRQGEHMDWGTKIFNYGRKEVRNFLLANAIFWLDQYHLDGLRVDAVASMLYLDYSREEGEWVPNRFGGRENLDAIEFLSICNHTVSEQFPGVLMFAEESTAYPNVTRPVGDGGLGFHFKWNMGWMNDTLRYIQTDPIFRKHEQQLLTFSMVYAYSENFVLPISHDEVVHGKGSLYGKMPGDEWQKRAGLRLYLAFMSAHPGKKLLFMGQEFGQPREWSEQRSLDWELLDSAGHRGLQLCSKHLNDLHRQRPAMHELDCFPEGFGWISCEDHDQSVYAFVRYSRNHRQHIVWIFNFTPVPRPDYRIGVPAETSYDVIFDSDSEAYGGSSFVRQKTVQAQSGEMHGCSAFLSLDVPPLGALALTPR